MTLRPAFHLWLLALALAAGAGVAMPGMPATRAPSGDDVWMPEVAPTGPVAIVVSLPEQRAYVYRNGVRIGVSPISSGKAGYETPSGIFTILQKHREHYSNLYDNAPMPYMQRLTWSGVALHAGSLPGYPASHGCIRLPAEFAEKLYSVTSAGTVVVVASEAFPPSVVSPGLFAPVDPATGQAHVADDAQEWAPQRAPEGPVTVLLSTADQAIVVLRNGIRIGRSGIVVRDPPPLGTLAFMLLEGVEPTPSIVVRDRPALRWLLLQPERDAAASQDLVRQAMQSGRIAVPEDFAREVYALLRPGATVIVTDEPLARPERVQVITSGQDGSR